MIEVGVDALNLAADRRGMGRYARTMLAGLSEQPDLVLTLIDRSILGELKSRRFDVMWYPWNGIRFTPSAPKVVTIHDPFAFTQAHSCIVARWREQTPIRRAARIARSITTVSRWSANEIARVLHLDAAAIEVIPPILDQFWRPAPLERTMHPYVLFVAGREPRKNASMLFAAFERAFPEGDVLLVVAGALSRIDCAALDRARIVHKRVAPNDEALRALYSGALAVAVPSIAEGYGLMAVEAMACGAAVIAAQAAALPEVCDGAALLVSARDPQAWSAALQSVAANDGLRLKLRERSLERVTRLDSEASVRAMAELLRRVAKGAR
ncbi:MAG: glycosyltransferase family 1 protein [Candidatus Baltobacteraceae bacterium]